MNATIVHREDGGFELRDWPSWAARVIDEMALLAGPEIPDERARSRLFPAPSDDPDAAEEWRRNVHPELFALLATAQEVVLKDLTSADRGKKGSIRRLVIPREHVPAWIAAVNAARLHLGAAHDVTADSMATPFEDLPEDVRPAVVRIDMLGELQYHLIRALEPVDEAGLPFPEDDEPPRAGGDPAAGGEPPAA
jgi:hypothetical protein